MPGLSDDNGGMDWELVREETLRMCEALREALEAEPGMLEAVVETLEDLARRWTRFLWDALAYYGEEVRKQLMSSLSAHLDTLLTGVYGERLGRPLAVLVNINYTSLLASLRDCGPSGDPGWARLLAALVGANMEVKRLRMRLTGKYGNPGG